jgi:ElaA protein
MVPRLVWADFQDLDRELLYSILQLRNEVFVVEQQSLFADIDGLDRHARHLQLFVDDELAGYLRLLSPGSDGDARVVISRVLLRKTARGKGLGRILMEAALAESQKRFGQRLVCLSAQIGQEAFYNRLGFTRLAGAPYDDAGILHIDMAHKQTRAGRQGTFEGSGSADETSS